jgi:hypothetical protein
MAQTAISMFPAVRTLYLSQDERQSSHPNETMSKLIVERVEVLDHF